jgi:hypothetical protein
MTIADADADAEVDGAARQAILAAAADYIEAWLDGDAERMGRCLHPDLVKREVEQDAAAGPRVDTMSRDDMVAATAAGYGRRYERPYTADVLDAFGDIATVRVLSSVYMDYLHIARFGDQWQLVNVLWQRRPGR